MFTHNSQMIKTLCLICFLAIFLTSCSKESSVSAPSQKSADEIKFEAEVKGLVQSGKDVNNAEKLVGETSVPILYWAVSKKYVDATKMLLENGANPNITFKETHTALSETIVEAQYGKSSTDQPIIDKTKAIAELLIKHGANVNYSSKVSGAPLHKAAKMGRVDLCKLFIESGADANALDELLGQTPLHNAAKNGYWECVQILLEKGAQPNIKNKLGQTALSFAEKREMEPVYKKTGKGYYPSADYDKTIQVLKQHGAE